MSNHGETPEWKSVADGHTLVFGNDNTFTSTQFDGCGSGTYTHANDVITLEYACANPPADKQYRIVSMTENELVLGNVNCIEQCGDKYIKQ